MEDRKYSCCFSGHRPLNLPAGGNESAERIVFLKALLRSKIAEAALDGITTFYSGMALGFDQFAAEAVLQMKVYFPAIQLIAVLPSSHQESRWNKTAQKNYRSLLCQADKVLTLSEVYYPGCELDRNRYMIDHSSRLIAYVAKQRTGTSFTVRYARECGISVILL